MSPVCEAGGDLVMKRGRQQLSLAEKGCLQQQDSSQSGVQWRHGREAVLHVSFDPGEWIIKSYCCPQFSTAPPLPQRDKAEVAGSAATGGDVEIPGPELKISPIMAYGTGAGDSRGIGTSLRLATL